MIKYIINKFANLKSSLKKKKIIAHAFDTLIEVGAHSSLDDAIIKSGYDCNHHPEDTANLITSLEEFLGDDLLLWQENKSVEEREDLMRNFIMYAEKRNDLPAL